MLTCYTFLLLRKVNTVYMLLKYAHLNGSRSLKGRCFIVLLLGLNENERQWISGVILYIVINKLTNHSAKNVIQFLIIEISQSIRILWIEKDKNSLLQSDWNRRKLDAVREIHGYESPVAAWRRYHPRRFRRDSRPLGQNSARWEKWKTGWENRKTIRLGPMYGILGKQNSNLHAGNHGEKIYNPFHELTAGRLFKITGH